MKTKDITPAQYAKLGFLKGNSTQNISKHLRLGNPLPHVIKVKRWSRFYTLEVPENIESESFTTDKIKYKKSKG
jgi:hypothetical protein